MNQAISYSIAALFAKLVPAFAIGLMLFNWNLEAADFTDLTPYYIDATILVENPYKEQDNSTQEEQRRNEILQQRRQSEAEFRRQQAEREKQQAQLVEATPSPEQVQPQELPEPEPPEEVPPPVSEEKPVAQQETGFEEQLARLVAAEQGLRQAITDDEKAMAYAGQIRKDIIQHWSRPPSARNGMQSVLRVFLVPTGELVDVRVDVGSGNDAFDRSALLAVRKVGRFAVPPDARMFERDFREFILVFRPEDLRL